MTESGQKQSQIQKLRSIGVYSGGAGGGAEYYGTSASGGAGGLYPGVGFGNGATGPSGPSNQSDDQNIMVRYFKKKFDEEKVKNAKNLSEVTKKAESDMRKMRTGIEVVRTELERTKGDILKETDQNLKESSSDTRKETFSVLGIFFTIFSFVSLSIQIFSRVDDIFSATIILFGLLLSTFSVVFIFLSVMYEKGFFVKFCAIVMPILSIGSVVVLFQYGKVSNTQLHPVGGSFQFTEGVRREIQEIVSGEILKEKYQNVVENNAGERMEKSK